MVGKSNLFTNFPLALEPVNLDFLRSSFHCLYWFAQCTGQNRSSWPQRCIRALSQSGVCKSAL